eukprot:2612247-Rhodomonas_salina.1
MSVTRFFFPILSAAQRSCSRAEVSVTSGNGIFDSLTSASCQLVRGEQDGEVSLVTSLNQTK